MENNFSYIVENVKKETLNVSTLSLKSLETLPQVRAGQFITIFFPDTGHAEGKSYSISDVIGSGSFSITVKGIGEFSNRLVSMKSGDKVSASLPYGYFYSESTETPLVFVAGGIGVAPFRAMISESLKITPERKLLLFYSDKTPPDVIFKKELDDLTEKFPETFQVRYYITQAENAEGMEKGRIPAEDIVEKSKSLKDAEFLICGSISFVRDFWRGLKAGGIDEGRIYTEAFF